MLGLGFCGRFESPVPTPASTQSLSAGVSVYVCNEHRYGYMNVAVKSHQGLEDEKVNFIHLILEALGKGWEPVLPLAGWFPASPPCSFPRPDLSVLGVLAVPLICALI